MEGNEYVRVLSGVKMVGLTLRAEGDAGMLDEVGEIQTEIERGNNNLRRRFKHLCQKEKKKS